jgi:hypothetical protein
MTYFTCTPYKPDFLLFQARMKADMFSVWRDCRISITFLFNVYMSIILERITEGRCETWGCFGVEERHKDIGCQICKVLSRTISGGWGHQRKFLRKASRWHLFLEPSCATSMERAQLGLTFSLRKKNGPRKPEIFCIKCDCCYLNWARAWTLSVLPGAWPSGPC